MSQPSTSSASASGMSNGIRSISAMIATRNTVNPMNCGIEKTFQFGIGIGPAITRRASCLWTMSITFRLPEYMRRATTARRSGISYAISCAAARMPPMRLYLLFDAHPAIKIPSGAIENAARMKRRLSGMFAITNPSLNGRAAKIITVDDAIRTGAVWNIAESAFAGVMFSFWSSFTPSATFWRYPRPRWVGLFRRFAHQEKGQNGRDQMLIMIPYRSWRRE